MPVDVVAEPVLFTPGFAYVGLSSFPSNYGLPNRALFTVPPWLHTCTVAASGTMLDLQSLRTGPRPTVCGVWHDVPLTPGDEWALEVGDPQDFLYGTGIIGSLRNTANGGDGWGISYTDGWGYAGASASIISRRPAGGGSEELWWCLGGAGGDTYPGTITGAGDHAVPGPITYGSPIPMTGYSDGADGGGDGGGDDAGGGGGGGWPGGTAGLTLADAGESGGNYLPDVDGASLGGPASPTWTEVFGAPFDPDVFAPADTTSTSGRVMFLFRAPTTSGWSIDEVRF